MLRFTALFAALATPALAATSPKTDATPVAILVLIVAIAGWIGLRSFVQNMRARKTGAAVGDSFALYALEVLVNAAKIDGRVDARERSAIATAMTEIGGAAVGVEAVEAAFAKATLGKAELVAYLRAKSSMFSRDQKTALLKALLSVFVADGNFDETEHSALVDYTAAVGFDRDRAPDMLRGFIRGNIT